MKLFSANGKEISSTKISTEETPITLRPLNQSAAPVTTDTANQETLPDKVLPDEILPDEIFSEQPPEESTTEQVESFAPTMPPEKISESPSRADNSTSFKVYDRRFWNLDEQELKEQDNARPQMPTFVEQLKTQLDEKDKQLREYIGAYKKEVGETLEKTKQRLVRESAQQLEQQRGQVILPMLEVLDALELSLNAAQTSDNLESLRTGIKMVHLLMLQKLQELGLVRIPTQNAPFNPAHHEAIAVIPVENPDQDNLVVQEFKTGFLLGERVLRPAQVQVGKCAAR